ncbi:hypothetical protein [Paenibacillus sedimenti]|uniref:Uncharacterized protein n=1 Tax=Paenibacillus sedimenti TaxID=2770274 RepID=A0A926KWC8_9BACL|nr:hypothetical protein [Paenibacillus sedimenti]MBD0384376.1 hypothetical protein [Paenibacillus sedimenti]
MSISQRVSEECLGEQPQNISIGARIRQRLQEGSELLNIFSTSFPFEDVAAITVLEVTNTFIRVGVATGDNGQDVFIQRFNQPIALLFEKLASDKPTNSRVLVKLPIGFSVDTSETELEGDILRIGKGFIEILTDLNFGTPQGSVFIIPLNKFIQVICLDDEE